MGLSKAISDAPPGSLMDSNVSPNLKQQKSKELGHVPWLAALGAVKGHVGTLG